MLAKKKLYPLTLFLIISSYTYSETSLDKRTEKKKNHQTILLFKKLLFQDYHNYHKTLLSVQLLTKR